MVETHLMEIMEAEDMDMDSNQGEHLILLKGSRTKDSSPLVKAGAKTEAEAFLANIPEETQEQYYELSAAKYNYAPGAWMPTPKLTQDECYATSLAACLSEPGSSLNLDTVLMPTPEGLDDEYMINPAYAPVNDNGEVLDWYLDAIEQSAEMAVELVTPHVELP
ncbi:hypothetical protein BKA82DRAFT_17723 [Pisolithus tinctorius]|uniref:Uncharacterized protein n=1 Tax=Pisolithus tinctorius Marx 270 TaxID=870435 RepID=A0A0C3K0H2_PISTI|nr:hypothetical protein BKA82DRAFT_17723 [Pisolithus tinctorius]KIO14873.1 hypothetical protein M404DRAFT_17723 [Pisolithus tinctorius Marx 270]